MGAIRHIGLVVPDPEAAEGYYRMLFEMELVGREAELEDGLWYCLPFDKTWEDARAAGIELGMTALRKGDLVLALFQGDAPQGQLFAVGLRATEAEIAGIRARLSGDAVLEADRPGALAFTDRYRILWQIGSPESTFSTSGEFAGRWIDF